MSVMMNPEGLRAVEDSLQPDLTRRAIQVETQAKRICPVDTGRLRASITHSVSRDAEGPVAHVGSDVEYALYVENRFGYLVGSLDAAKA